MRPGAHRVLECEVAQGLGERPRVQRIQPLDHRAALAAVEVHGVAQLAHARVHGDEAEEDAQREQHDAEVHPAARVVGVPHGRRLGARVTRPRLVASRRPRTRSDPRTRLSRTSVDRTESASAGAARSPGRGRSGSAAPGMASSTSMRGMTCVGGCRRSDRCRRRRSSRTAWRSPLAPGADLPLHTTGALRRTAVLEMTGFGSDLGANCTRKLAWLTMTWAGSRPP